MSLETQERAPQERSIDDREYIRSLCENGDEAGFFALIETMRTEATNYLAGSARSSRDVDDILQRAAINVLKAFREGLYDVKRNLKPWYFTVLRNAAIDHRRRDKRWNAMASLQNTPSSNDNEVEGVDGTHVIESKEEDPALGVEQREERVIVESIVGGVLKRMSARQREMLRGIYWRGLMYRELAEEMNVPEGTVKSGMYAAKQSFKRLLGDSEQKAA